MQCKLMPYYLPAINLLQSYYYSEKCGKDEQSMYARTEIAMDLHCARCSVAEDNGHYGTTTDERPDRKKPPKASYIPNRYIPNRSQKTWCTAVMRWRCQRSRIAACNRNTATLLGIRLFLGPKPIHDFCAYRGLARRGKRPRSEITSAHLLGALDDKATHYDV